MLNQEVIEKYTANLFIPIFYFKFGILIIRNWDLFVFWFLKFGIWNLFVF